MPPDTTPVPVPTTWGRDAAEWLEAHGLVARVPPSRASDYELVLSDPFGYYLTVRLGLCSPFAWSKALSRGSWFHKRLEFLDLPEDDARAAMNRALAERHEELREIGQARGMVGDPLQNVLRREEEDCLTAWAWFEAAARVPINDKYGTFPEFLSRFALLGCELLLSIPHRRSPRACRIDRLLYHEPSNALWILDAKTCDDPPTVRLSTCPIEFATAHYLHILQDLLLEGVVHAHFDLPPDVTVGGMMHLACQKPPIRMCGEDRDFEWVEHTLKSGPRKGQVELRKRFTSDEPRHPNYVERCRRWLLGEGEYVDRRAEAEAERPVNLSFTPASMLLDEEGTTRYYRRLDYLYDHATRPAWPCNFLMSGSRIRQYGKLDPMAPFYLKPPAEWPGLVEEKGLIVKHRDEQLTGDSGPLIE